MFDSVHHLVRAPEDHGERYRDEDETDSEDDVENIERIHNGELLMVNEWVRGGKYKKIV